MTDFHSLILLVHRVDNAIFPLALLIHKNRRLTLGELILPNLNIAALWLFWAALPDRCLWCLYVHMKEKSKKSI